MNYSELHPLKMAAEKVLAPMSQWKDRCHEASVALVRSGVIKGARVARGSCRLVPSQHSWVVLGDPYLTATVILDPTLWGHTRVSPEVWIGKRNRWGHRPHGAGNIYDWGRPNPPTGKVITLTPPKGGWSGIAESFLKQLGPLDFEGWRVLTQAPVQGWPATEILTQLRKHPQLGAFIPIDIVGMVIGDECGGLYPRS